MTLTGTKKTSRKMAKKLQKLLILEEMKFWCKPDEISNKTVDTKATPVGGGIEAERGEQKIKFASLRGAIRRDMKIVWTISTINDKHTQENNFW